MIDIKVMLNKLNRRAPLVFAINKREYDFLLEYGKAANVLYGSKSGLKKALGYVRLKYHNIRLALCYRRITPIITAIYFLRSNGIRFKWDTRQRVGKRKIAKMVLVYL